MSASTAERQVIKILPHSKEAEQSVLGAILYEPAAFHKVEDILNPDGTEFYMPAHRLIFQIMAGLVAKHEPIDIVTVSTRLHGAVQMDSVGGIGYVVDLVEATPTAANIAYYARIVRDKALRRRVITGAQELIDEALQDLTVEELIESAQKRFTAIDTHRARGFYSIRQLLKEGFDEIEALQKNKGAISGLSSGLPSLDYILGGFQNTDLALIAGRPSMGKSSLCCQIATNLAIDGKRVGYFSIEVGNRQVIKNIMACQSQIETTRFRHGDFKETEWARLSDTIGSLYDRTFSIDDFSRSSIDIMRQARRMYAEHGLDIIFIDHIHEMREKGRQESRNQEIDIIAGNLKELAKELNIPVVVVAQLSRDVEKRGGDCKPRLSDLRDSGTLEQKADVIMFVYREEYYLKEKAEKKGIAEVSIEKHRNGPLGTAEFVWRKEYIRFDELYRGQI